MEGVQVEVEDLKALSSKTRLRLLNHLNTRNYNVTELSGKLSLSKSTVHEHIAKLSGAGFIERDENVSSKWAYYKLTRKGKKILDSNQQRLIILFSAVFSLIIGLAFTFIFFAPFSQVVPIGFEAGEALSSAVDSTDKGAVPAEGDGDIIIEAPAGEPPSMREETDPEAAGAPPAEPAPSIPFPAWLAPLAFFLAALLLTFEAQRRGRGVRGELE